MTINKLVAIFMVFLTTMMTACSSGIPQEVYDTLNNQLEAARSEVAQVKGENASLKNQLDKANISQTACEELKTKYELSLKDYEACEAKYKTLLQQYETVTSKVVAPVIDTDVEEALFDAINQRRTESGLTPFLWGTNLYSWAKSNSKTMAQSKTMTYSDYYAPQEIFWAIGYDSLEKITNAAMTMWSLNEGTFKTHFLQKVTYGAVGAYKDGGIFYITYMADVFK